MKAEYDVEVEWKAYELHPEFPPEGNELDWMALLRRKVMHEHLASFAEEVGLPLGEGMSKTPNSRLSLEAAEFARDKGKFDEFHRAVFHAYFAADRDIGDKTVLADVAQEVGLNPDEMRKALDERAYKEAVDKQIDQARELEVTAVPTFIIGDQTVIGAESYERFKLAMSSLNVK